MLSAVVCVWLESQLTNARDWVCHCRPSVDSYESHPWEEEGQGLGVSETLRVAAAAADHVLLTRAQLEDL
jgi:hypothetical protein